MLNCDQIWEQPRLMEDLLEWLMVNNKHACNRLQEKEDLRKLEEKIKRQEKDFNEMDFI